MVDFGTQWLIVLVPTLVGIIVLAVSHFKVRRRVTQIENTCDCIDQRLDKIEARFEAQDVVKLHPGRFKIVTTKYRAPAGNRSARN